MLVRVAGDNIMMSPPYILSLEEIDEVISMLVSLVSCSIALELGLLCLCHVDINTTTSCFYGLYGANPRNNFL